MRTKRAPVKKRGNVKPAPLQPFLMLWTEEKGRSACMLDIGVFSDPGVWGVVLADAVEHVANAFSQQGEDRDAVRQRVLEFFHKEIANPTDTVTGGIAQGDAS